MVIYGPLFKASGLFVLGLLIIWLWFVLSLVGGICFPRLFLAPGSWVPEITDGLFPYVVFFVLAGSLFPLA